MGYVDQTYDEDGNPDVPVWVDEEPDFDQMEPNPYREAFICWAPQREGADPFGHDHDPDVACDWGWVCNRCSCRVDDEPCPDHAPLTPPPGMRLVECQATPRHWLFAHDRDDYGHGCPWCWYEEEHAELTPLKMAAERREHRWCWLLNPVKRLAVRAGVARWRGSTMDHACHHIHARWRWSR